jgi:hypothetical protein
MRKEVAEVTASIKRSQAQNWKRQFAYGGYTELPDKKANEMGLLPDFEKLEETDPELFRKFYDNRSFSVHWNFDEDPALALRLMNEIDEMGKVEYEIADESKLTFDEKVRLFNRKYKFKTNLDF